MGESVTARLDDLSFGMSRGRSFFVGFFFVLFPKPFVLFLGIRLFFVFLV